MEEILLSERLPFLGLHLVSLEQRVTACMGVSNMRHGT